ncbi:SAM-dependent methyltransferase [Mycobacterium sp. PO1]|nr:SAM-dependent methyltransferase [Mycobacterium sp. PO1]GFM22812.1 SAM-dependent methyltransferase [Mycobacterium sp. PO2]
MAYLRSAEGRAALDEVAGYQLTDASLIAEISSARARFGDQAGVLVETVRLRRRASVKLRNAGGWLFTDEALQQATATPVAEHRARRLAGAVVHDVTCSVGTELAALRDTAQLVVGSDLDAVRLAMAEHNLGLRGDPVLLCRADALRPVTADAVVVADPARRSGTRRRFDPRGYLPPLDDLIGVLAGREYVVKCAPGIDFDAVRRLGFDGEVEVASWSGSVREACLWSRGLSPRGVRRRASVLDTGEQFTDGEPDDCAVRPAGTWIVDPDGAVVRAGLVRQYAVRHGLWQLDADIAYLSGDRLPAGVRGFEVLDTLPYHERRLRQALSDRGVGAVEILVRGLDVDPDVLRSRLRLRGSSQATVILTRLGSGRAGRATAFICRPSR